MSKIVTLRLDDDVDDAEMAELVVNDDLMKRLRAGSRDAAKRRGKFVE